VNRRLPLVLALAPVCLSGLALSFPAAAGSDISGWYTGGDLGLNIGTSQNLSAGSNGVRNDYGSGLIGGFRGGYAFANGLRPELEFEYRHSSMSSTKVQDSIGTSQPVGYNSGSLTAETLMGNLWYDFRQPEGTLSVIYPYVGAGIGLARVGINSENISTFQDTGGIANGSGTAFAYQLGFGANVEITSFLIASMDVRYLMTTNVSIPVQTTNSSFGDLKGEYHAPALFFGLSYKFGTDAS